MGGPPSWSAAGDVGRAAGLVAAFVRSAAAAPAPGAARRGGVDAVAVDVDTNRRVGLVAAAAPAGAAAGAGRRWGMLAELMELLDRASREGGHRAPGAADDAARLRAVCAAVAAALPRPPFRDARRALAAVALVSTVGRNRTHPPVEHGPARRRRRRAVVQHCQCSPSGVTSVSG